MCHVHISAPMTDPGEGDIWGSTPPAKTRNCKLKPNRQVYAATWWIQIKNNSTIYQITLVLVIFDLHCASKKNQTPITFWNNSNKLCLKIIMISWENRQKVLNIVVCYGLTIFHKTGYQLKMNWSSAWWRSDLAYSRPLSMTQSTNGEDVSGPVFE